MTQNLLPKLSVRNMICQSNQEQHMSINNQGGEGTLFEDLPAELRATVATNLFDSLHDLLVEGRDSEIANLRAEMQDKYNMSYYIFQEHLEQMYNQQHIQLIDPDTHNVLTANMHLTVIPITFFPDHDIEHDVVIQSTLGTKYASWSQELVQAGIKANFFRGIDNHYVVPALFDINDLFKTHGSAFNLISDIVNLQLPEKYPLKNIVLTKEASCKTMYFVMATSLDDINAKGAIIPDPKQIFSEFEDMRMTMESIINHYWTNYSKGEYSGTAIVGPPIQGSIGARLNYPCTMMGHLNYNLLKISHALELDKTTVIVERNTVDQTYLINVYFDNKCLLSYKYPESVLAEGLEEDLFTYVLDTNGFSKHRFIDVTEHTNTHEKIKEPLLRVVK